MLCVLRRLIITYSCFEDALIVINYIILVLLDTVATPFELGLFGPRLSWRGPFDPDSFKSIGTIFNICGFTMQCLNVWTEEDTAIELSRVDLKEQTVHTCYLFNNKKAAFYKNHKTCANLKYSMNMNTILLREITCFAFVKWVVSL